MAIEIFENYVPEEVIEELLKIRDRNKKVMQYGEIWEHVEHHFSELFREIGAEPESVSGKYFYTKIPFSTHSDGLSSFNCSKPANTNIFVPLQLEPVGVDSYTIYFDQFEDTPMHGRIFYKHKKPKYGKPTPVETDYSNLRNITDESFDRDIYDKYLSYMNYEDFHGLTFHKAVKWNIGDIIKFESNRLHCSSEFSATGLNAKTHLFFKLYIPE